MKHEIMLREPDLYFDSIHQELNNFLRDTIFTNAFANPLNVKKKSIWRPAIEVKQTDENYCVKAQLPGVKKEDIQIELDNEFMTISAETKEEKEENDNDKNCKYHTSEFRYGKYQRTISFDTPIQTESVKAKYQDGVLKIKIPKQKIEKTQAKHIEIE